MLDFGRGFARIRETLGEDSQGFETLGEDLQDIGRGSVRSHETLGEDLQGFARLWERICKDLGFAGHLQGDFGRGFARIRETLR